MKNKGTPGRTRTCDPMLRVRFEPDTSKLLNSLTISNPLCSSGYGATYRDLLNAVELGGSDDLQNYLKRQIGLLLAVKKSYQRLPECFRKEESPFLLGNSQQFSDDLMTMLFCEH